MTRYAVLLHAVNVGGTKKLPMATLRSVATDLGYSDVATHLASGNLVVQTDDDAGSVAAAVSAGVKRETGIDTPCSVRTVDQLAAALRANPLAVHADDPSRHALVFCLEPPASSAVADIATWATLPERLAFDGTDVHLWAPGGFGDTAWTKAALRRRLGVNVTVRNWRTVVALHDRLAAMPESASTPS